MSKKTWVIYIHKNKINGKVYIGQTCKKNVNQRWQNGEGYKSSTKFYNAIQKYGWDNFEHGIIVEGIENLESANELECYWIEQFNSINNGYNIASGGSNGNTFEGKTEEEMEEIKKRQSESQKKRWGNITEEEMEEKSKKLSESAKKSWKDTETRRKHSEANKKRFKNMTEEEKKEWSKKCSKNHTDVSGEKNPMYGKHHSEKTRRKLSEITEKKSTICIDNLGKVREFVSTHEAEKWLGKKGVNAHISACCNAKTMVVKSGNIIWKAKHPYGYYWYYLKDIEDLFFTESTPEERARILEIRRKMDRFTPTEKTA